MTGQRAEAVSMLEQLEIRYRHFKESAKLPKALGRRASAPLLVSPHARWESAKTKMLIVGQETLRWQYDPQEIGASGKAIRTFSEFAGATDGVSSMCKLYRWYGLGRRYPKLNSPFWRGFRVLDAAVNSEIDSALWTNVFKVNVNGSVVRNCTRAEIVKLHKAQQGLLQHEVQVLRPDVVVFFTGPSYDSALRAEFPDLELRPFGHTSSCASSRSSLALLSASGLPAKAVRSYHPEYLQRSRQWGVISEIARWASC